MPLWLCKTQVTTQLCSPLKKGMNKSGAEGKRSLHTPKQQVWNTASGCRGWASVRPVCNVTDHRILTVVHRWLCRELCETWGAAGGTSLWRRLGTLLCKDIWGIWPCLPHQYHYRDPETARGLWEVAVGWHWCLLFHKQVPILQLQASSLGLLFRFCLHINIKDICFFKHRNYKTKT